MRKTIEQLKLMLLELYADPERVTTATPKYQAFHRAAMMLCGEYRLYDDVDWRSIEKNLLQCKNAYFTSGEAFKELNNAVKAKVQSRLDKGLDGQKLMQHVFSQERPILLVEDNLDTQTNRDTQQGYMMMFSGAMSAIRNPKAHENMVISRDDAVRKLIFASMLMYKLDASHFAAEQRRILE